jgi:hypothetical protein
MSLIQRKKKRDLEIDRETDQIYTYLVNKLGAERREIFFLAFKYAIFKNLEPLPLGKKSLHIGQFEDVERNLKKDIDFMIMAIYVKTKNDDLLIEGDELLNLCEEYANTGVRALYDLFTNEKKNDIYIVEDIVSEILKKINSNT